MAEAKSYKVPKPFVDLVRGELDRHGLTFRDMKRRAGISASFLSRMLTGKRKLPSDKMLLRLAVALDIVPPEKLLIEAGRMPPGRPEVVQLFRATGDLTAKEVNQVLKVVKQIKQRKRKRP